MTNTTASLVIKVDSSGAKRATSDLDQLADSAGRSEGAAAKLERQAKITGAVLAGLATGVIALAIKNTMEQERVTAQLEARLRSTGGAAGLAKQELLDMASGLQAVTTYGDESIITAQSLLLTFTKIGRDVFPTALETVLDMSTAMGQDLKSSAIQLGKALNDPIEGVSALTRVGVQFTDAQKDTIERLVETGKTAEAQKIILAELETQMGGSARAARDTLGGALEGLKNAFGDLLEGDTGSDGVRGATQAINDLTAVLNSQEVKDGFGAIVNGIFTVSSELANAIGMLGQFAEKVRQTFKSTEDKSIEGLIARRNQLAESMNRMDSRASFRLGTRLGFNDGNAALAEQIRQLDAEIAGRRALQLSSALGAKYDTPTATGPVMGSQDQPRATATLDTATGKVRAPRGGSGRDPASILDTSSFTRDQIRAEASAMDEANRATAGWLTRIEDLRAELDGPLAVATLGYQRALEQVNAAQAAGYITAEQAAEATRMLGEQHEDAAEKIKNSGDQMSEFAIQAARNMQSTFSDLFFDPFADGVSGLADRFADSLRRMAADLASSKLLEAVGGWASGYTGAGSGWINAIGGAMTKGGRAAGGPVMAGSSYIVGERGRPEIFTPSTSGRITQVGAGQTNLKVSVQIEHKGSEALSVESQQNEVRPDGSVFVRMITNTVKQGMARGEFDGDMSRNFGIGRRGTPRG